jgi:hypothetical protein
MNEHIPESSKFRSRLLPLSQRHGYSVRRAQPQCGESPFAFS